mmetsp:Transcript_23134/g.32335  ORF Transcript_23134/g.32335 Transcript_23134/m.32335 type:complete len:259 (-) Transcript_23134:84-860(-)
MGFGVHILDVIGSNTSSSVFAELTLVGILILLLQLLHVFTDVTTENVLTLGFAVSLKFSIFVDFGTRETLVAVRDIESSVARTLKSAKKTGSSGGSSKTNVEQSAEGTGPILVKLVHGEFVIEVFLTPFIHITICTDRSLVFKLELLVDAACEEKASAVCCRVVGEANFHSITWKLVRISGRDAHIICEVRGEDLAHNILIGETNDESILWSLIFVFILKDESLTSVIISFAFPATLELHLVSLEVSLILNDFYESHS